MSQNTPSASHVQKRFITQVTHQVQAEACPCSCLLMMMMMMMMSEFIVAQWFLAGLDEDALHSTPPVVLIGGAHAVHLPLSTYGVAVLLACHAQEDVGAYVFEAHSLVALPVNAFALNRPHVQVVTLAVLSESTHLLWTVQRTREAFVPW